MVGSLFQKGSVNCRDCDPLMYIIYYVGSIEISIYFCFSKWRGGDHKILYVTNRLKWHSFLESSVLPGSIYMHVCVKKTMCAQRTIWYLRRCSSIRVWEGGQSSCLSPWWRHTQTILVHRNIAKQYSLCLLGHAFNLREQKDHTNLLSL